MCWPAEKTYTNAYTASRKEKGLRVNRCKPLSYLVAGVANGPVYMCNQLERTGCPALDVKRRLDYPVMRTIGANDVSHA